MIAPMPMDPESLANFRAWAVRRGRFSADDATRLLAHIAAQDIETDRLRSEIDNPNRRRHL